MDSVKLELELDSEEEWVKPPELALVEFHWELEFPPDDQLPEVIVDEESAVLLLKVSVEEELLPDFLPTVYPVIQPFESR